MHGHSTCRGSGFAFSTAGDFRDQELMAWYKDPLVLFLQTSLLELVYTYLALEMLA